MNEFQTAKEAYENIPIPEELNERVQAGIRQGSEGLPPAPTAAGLCAIP